VTKESSNGLAWNTLMATNMHSRQASSRLRTLQASTIHQAHKQIWALKSLESQRRHPQSITRVVQA
jgi:hypothetical protein